MLLDPTKHWACPNCPHTHVTKVAAPHTPFHPCAGLAGLTAPMTEVGVSVKVEAVEREDYIGSEDVRLDGNGRPIMSVITTRDDGQDCTVYAPTAHARLA